MFITVILLSSIIVFINSFYVNGEFEYMENIGEKFIKNKTGIHRLIFGGGPAIPHEFPWMCSLKLHGTHNCGASLINNKWVLTAAHCVVDRDFKDLRVVCGEHNVTKPEDTEKECNLDKVIIHKDYGNPRYANDIALLKLSKKVDENQFIKSIALPKSNQDFEPGLNCTTIGWGYTEGNRLSDVLIKVFIKVMKPKECNDQMNGLITEGMICTQEEGKTACNGDSGSPLQMIYKGKWIQIGITSWGIRGCPLGYPSVFTRVSHYVEWINVNIKNN